MRRVRETRSCRGALKRRTSAQTAPDPKWPEEVGWRSGGARRRGRPMISGGATARGGRLGLEPLALLEPALVAHIHQLAQLLAAARQARSAGPDGDPEDQRDLLVAHALEPDPEDHLTLFLRHLGDGAFEAAPLQYGERVGMHDQHRRHFLDGDMDALVHRAAHIIDVLVMKDREEPGPQVGAGLPEVLLGDGSGQAALDEIVGPGHIAGQGARVAAQPRNFHFEQPSEIAHRETSSLLSRPVRRGLTMVQRMAARCNPMMYRESLHGKEL